MSLQELSKIIISNVGGNANIQNATNCSTRLRLTLRDESLVNYDAFKSIKEIIDVVNGSGQLQFIIGSNAGKLAIEVNRIIGESDGKTAASQPVKKNPLMIALDYMTGSFAPIVPVIIASGLLSAVLSVLTTFHIITASSQSYQLIKMAADSGFYFLPVLLAFSAAKKLSCNSFLAAMIVGMLLHPTFSGLFAETGALSLFGLPVANVTYSSSVIPALLIVAVMAPLERLLDRLIPEIIKVFFKPLAVVIIMLPLSFVVLAPIGYYIGTFIAAIISFISINVPWLVPTVLGAFGPILVMFGAHHALQPLIQQSMASFHYDAIVGPAFLAMNIAQGASALAVALKTKKTGLKQTAFSAAFAALLGGVTEPAMYGVTSKLKKPLIAVMVSGAVAGCFAGIMGMVRYSFGAGSLLTIPLFIGENPKNVIYAVITMAISFIVSFGLTWILGFDDKEFEE